ncbi:hypothetical protein BR93DRAFT_927618 [Coniochaeta sp. PMI_546]|nr:hypothetical protein BR93DRAFT_927618 [Coniochaeta sp. PMI_546]
MADPTTWDQRMDIPGLPRRYGVLTRSELTTPLDSAYYASLLPIVRYNIHLASPSLINGPRYRTILTLIQIDLVHRFVVAWCQPQRPTSYLRPKKRRGRFGWERSWAKRLNALSGMYRYQAIAAVDAGHWQNCGHTTRRDTVSARASILRSVIYTSAPERLSRPHARCKWPFATDNTRGSRRHACNGPR